MVDHGLNRDFAQCYKRYFDIVRADTPALLDEAYRLRYQVYCIENPFENVTEHPDERERDADDDRSIHALLRHRSTGAFAGTVRVILPHKGVPHRALPVRQLLAKQNRNYVKRVPWRTTGEISRFAVSKQFRRRRAEDRYPDVLTPGTLPRTDDERHVVPYITFGLIRGVLEICREYGVANICAVMEPALIRILGRFGLDFEPIGDLIEHHGMRQPCVARLDELVERNRTDGTLLWQYANMPIPPAPHLAALGAAPGGAVAGAMR